MQIFQQHSSIYTRRSFGMGIVVASLLIFALLAWKFDNGESELTSHLLIGIPLMLAWIVSMIGLSSVFKSRREKKTFKWFFGVIINGGVMLTVIVLLGINIAAIAKLFSLI